MKPLIFSSIFLVLSLFCFSQESQVFESSLGVDIRVTAITTDEHYVLRKIELIDRSADTAFDTFEHEIVSDEGETESIEVALNAGTFSGFIYIKSGETVIEALHINNGENDIEGSYRLPDPEKCTWKILRKCVRGTIDNMNWVEYGICLLAAPECYGTIWAACMWDCLNTD